MIDNILNNYQGFLLVFIRMNGMILFNPLLGRRNIPAPVKMGLAFIMSVLVMGSTDIGNVEIYGVPDLIIKGLMELAVGFAFGSIMNMFFSAVLIGTEFMDIQLGLSMAKIYDPFTNVSMPITGSLFNAALILMFLATKGHHTLVILISQSFQALGVGMEFNWQQAAIYIIGMFMNALVLGLKLAIPIIAVELIFEMCLGTMMRAVPQINVFNVGVQLRLVIGLLVLVFIAPLLGSYFDSLYTTMFNGMQGLFGVLAA